MSEKVVCPVCGGDKFRWEMNGCKEEGWHCVSVKGVSKKDPVPKGWEVFHYGAIRDNFINCTGRPGEPPGYCPQLDRQDTEGKVFDILNFLHENDVTYVSNGSMGDDMTGSVVEWCKEFGFYDQESIVVRLLQVGGGMKHSLFWKEEGEGVVSGNDKRDRCPCGALSISMRSFKGRDSFRCKDHGHDQKEGFR